MAPPKSMQARFSNPRLALTLFSSLSVFYSNTRTRQEATSDRMLYVVRRRYIRRITPHRHPSTSFHPFHPPPFLPYLVHVRGLVTGWRKLGRGMTQAQEFSIEEVLPRASSYLTSVLIRHGHGRHFQLESSRRRRLYVVLKAGVAVAAMAGGKRWCFCRMRAAASSSFYCKSRSSLGICSFLPLLLIECGALRL